MPSPYVNSFLLCHNAAAPFWQLGPFPPPQGAFVLLGWTVPAPDGGVPPSVATALCEALLALGPLAFATNPKGALHLCHTPGEATVLFDTPEFPWWLQGQFALVFSLPPKLPTWPESLLEPAWASAFPALSAAGVIAILRPAHSSASTNRLPRAAAAFSSWRRVGEWRGFSSRCAEGQEVCSERASSAKDRSPRARRISRAA